MKDSRETMDELAREAKKLREMIREDNSWYQVKLSCNVIFDSIKAGVSIMDTEGVYTFINKVSADRFKMEPEEMIGRRFGDFLGEKEAENYEEEVMRPVLSGGREIRSRKIMVVGKRRYLLDFHSRPVRDETGRITGILNMSFDVFLDEKRKKYTAIQENINYISFHTDSLEDTIREIFNLLCGIDCIRSGGIYVFDPDKQLLELVHHYNLPGEFVQHAKSYGTDSMNYQIVARGVPQYDINSGLGDERKMINESFGLSMVAAIPMINENRLIGCIVLSIEESEEFTEEDKTFIESMAWRIARVIALIRSRDQFLNTNRELNEKISELRENQQLLIRKSKLESLGELSAGMAHEINQPLIVISLSIENILQKLSTGQKNLPVPYLQKKFGSILHNVNRIQQIIDNMRTFARDQTSIIFEKVNLSEVVEKSLTLIKVQCRSEGIKLSSGMIDQNLRIIGNPFKLEQVIVNLLSNSRYAVNEKEKRSGASAYQKEIRLIVVRIDNYIIIELWDNGIGIPEENIEKLFTPFFTTKMEGEGTGLGLPIVYGIVKELNGEIKVDSIQNEFTQIRIILPSV